MAITQVTGWGADETVQGHVRQSLSKSGLVPVQFRLNDFVGLTELGVTGGAGGAGVSESTVIYNAAAVSFTEFGQSELFLRADRHATVTEAGGVVVTPFASVNLFFSGRRVGVVMNAGVTGNFLDGFKNVCATIDGKAYPFPIYKNHFGIQGPIAQGLLSRHIIIADDLPDGMHEMEIYCGTDGNGLTDPTWSLYCLLLEERLGYVKAPVISIGASIQLEDASARSLNFLAYPAFVALTQITAMNPTGGAITLSVVKDGKTLVNALSIAANTITPISVLSWPVPLGINLSGVTLQQSASGAGLIVEVEGLT